MGFTAPRSAKKNEVSYTPRSKERTGLWQIGLIATAFVIIVLGTFILFINNIAKDNHKTMLSELTDYAQTAQLTLSTRIRDDFATLNVASACLAEMDDIDGSTLAMLVKQINYSSEFTRLGYARPDGQVDMYDIDGSVYQMDFFADEFFHKALNGENAIQDTTWDEHLGNYIIRYATPLMKNGEITGALVLTYQASLYSDVVNLNKWSGYGYANVINSEGDFIIRADSPMIPADALSLYDLGIFTESDRQVNITRRGYHPYAT